jgi:aryl-alcohol dehydrogenase-like predicted oxidoreductase
VTDYRPLGRTGIHVSPLCLGAMMLGDFGNRDHDDGVQLIHRALDAGINFIDTADVYSLGESEQIVGKALSGGRRDDVILATKCFWPMDVPIGQPGGDPNKRGSSRRWIVRAVDDSLRRLHTDWIDLYQVHRRDDTTDIEETIDTLTDLRREGKIRAFGTSTFPAHELVEAQWVSERRGLGRFSTEQPPYSLLTRGIEADVLPVAERYGLGVLTWGPLAAGWLTGSYRIGGPQPVSRRGSRMPARFDISLPENQRKLVAADRLAQIAEAAGLTLIHLALAFVLEHPAVSSAIIGPRTIEHLESQLGADTIRLDPDVLDLIDEAVPPATTFSRLDVAYEPPSVTDPTRRRRRR